jgi:ribosomal protein L2
MKHFATVRKLAGIAVFALPMIGLHGCEQEPVDEPHGGGYVAPQAQQSTSTTSTTGEPEPEAKSYLGKAKQAAERVIKEDVAEYNKKVEQAADDVFKKGK